MPSPSRPQPSNISNEYAAGPRNGVAPEFAGYSAGCSEFSGAIEPDCVPINRLKGHNEDHGSEAVYQVAANHFVRQLCAACITLCTIFIGRSVRNGSTFAA